VPHPLFALRQRHRLAPCHPDVFPGDPLLAYDPIFLSVPEPARDRLMSRFSLDVTQEAYALGYDFDIVLRGPRQTPMER
jgi:protocatechuate 3,4-dioxygenase, beta subunit